MEKILFIFFVDSLITGLIQHISFLEWQPLDMYTMGGKWMRPSLLEENPISTDGILIHLDGIPILRAFPSIQQEISLHKSVTVL
ncbi:MAG: hypothetical protein ACD_17C00079G0004 [uncultured bacterium]|nr:MAG: hypothetical protein ACD_17C00079G0004 [uncultured bacterium]OGN67781.1 MAG: hypothetical protein A3I67_05090 [Chlamydiae bacterium RIFCSPLOWO2_02_FULL_45_22]